MKRVKTMLRVCCVLCAIQLMGDEIKAPEAPFVKTDRALEKVGPVMHGIEGIKIGAKKLRLNTVSHFTDSDFIVGGRILFGLNAMSSPSVPKYAPFDFTTTQAENKIKRTAAFRVNESVTGTYEETFDILPDGRIGCFWESEVSSTMKRHPEFRTLCFSKGVIKGMRCSLNGKPLDIVKTSESPDGIQFNKTYGIPKTMVLAVDNPELKCEIEFVNIRYLSICQLFGRICMILRPVNYDEARGIIINPGLTAVPDQKENIVSGINFTRNNAFDVAVFQQDGNLLMNPSFESGSRYYVAWKAGFPPDGLYDGDARSGKFSYRFDKGYKEGMRLSTLCIPIKANRQYTISFYAKSLDDKNAFVGIRFYSNYQPQQLKGKQFTVKGSGEWQRFEATFSTPARAIQLGFSGSTNCIIDDLQLEEAPKATEYKGNPVGLELLTDSPDKQNVDVGKAINAKLLIRGKAGQEISGKISVTDFFARQDYTADFSDVIPENGELLIPIQPDFIWKKGLNIVRVDIDVNGYEFSDFLRLSLYKFADNTKKHKNLHGIYNFPDFSIFPDKELRFAQSLGMGAITGSLDYSKECYDKQKKYGFDDFGRTWYVQEVSYTPKKVRWHVVDGKKLTLNDTTYLESDTYPQEFLEEAEKLVCSFAEKHPWITFYEGLSEPQAAYASLRNHKLDQFAKFVLAVKRGVEAANPNNLYCPHGAYNMGRGGREDVLSVLRKCRELEPKSSFKTVDIHTYRPFPEEPDTEQDLRAFIDGLAKLGYTKDNFKIKLREGSYFYPLIVNEFYIAPWAGVSDKDRFSVMRIPSYDLGWGERVGAAMWLRTILVYYKYADHLLMTCPWLAYTIDQRVPYSWAVASAALTDLLGNGTYLEDVQFSPNTKCFLFDDGNGSTAAALWKYSEQMDRGYEPGTVMSVDFGNDEPEIIDMMGNRCQAPKEHGRLQIPLSNFPVFIKNKDKQRVAEAIKGALVASEKDENPLHAEIRVLNTDMVEIVMENRLARPVTTKISIDDGSLCDYQWKPFEKREITQRLKKRLSFEKFNEVSIPFVVKVADGKTFTNSYTSTILPVKHVGENIDWKQIPYVALNYIGVEEGAKRKNLKWNGPGDLGAACKLAWNKENLYLLVDVVDDKISFPPAEKKEKMYYQYEGVQLFFDAFGDAGKSLRKGVMGYDGNDFSYELLPTAADKALAYRRLAPDIQFTGGALHPFRSDEVVPDLYCDFKAENNKRIYKTVFSAHFLKPLRLEAGNIFGFAIKIMDRDGADPAPCKLNICNIPQEKGDPFRKPHLYTQILLVK